MLSYQYGMRPLLYALCGFDAELVHDVAMILLRQEWAPTIVRAVTPQVQDARLRQEVFGIPFANPVGLAPGIDKQGVALRAFEAFQFGSITVGGVVPKAQKGNPKKRLFNLWRDKALVNWMGFNSVGAVRVLNNLNRTGSIGVPLGVNLGVNKENAGDPETALNDFLDGLTLMYGLADYFEINISSPNTKGLRELIASLDSMLSRLHEKNQQLADELHIPPKPLLVKLSGDMSFELLLQAIETIAQYPNSGVILINTTTSRGGLRSAHPPKQGGMSGLPLFGRALERVRFARECHPTLPIVANGGIAHAQDAVEMLSVGANLLQVCTSFVVMDPFVAPHINAGILAHMQREGMTSITDFQQLWR